MQCSLSECRGDLLGMCVVISPQDEDVDMSDTGMLIYRGMNFGMPTQWAMLHPNCYTDLVSEITRQGGSSALNVFIGSVGDIKEALELT